MHTAANHVTVPSAIHITDAITNHVTYCVSVDVNPNCSADRYANDSAIIFSKSESHPCAITVTHRVADILADSITNLRSDNPTSLPRSLWDMYRSAHGIANGGTNRIPDTRADRLAITVANHEPFLEPVRDSKHLTHQQPNDLTYH